MAVFKVLLHQIGEYQIVIEANSDKEIEDKIGELFELHKDELIETSEMTFECIEVNTNREIDLDWSIQDGELVAE